MTKFYLTMIAVFVGPTSYADQCYVVTKQQADLAKAVIEAQSSARMGTKQAFAKTTISYVCETCENDAKETIVVDKVVLETKLYSHQLEPNEAIVSVIDESGKSHDLDLAYAFLNIGLSGTPVRLAPLAGCSYVLDSDDDVLK